MSQDERTHIFLVRARPPSCTDACDCLGRLEFEDGLATCSGGQLFIDFERSAASYDEAVQSAVRDIACKLPGVAVEAVFPG
ncbi:hypothetical protein ACTVH1_17545 [Gluconobacter cerinus]